MKILAAVLAVLAVLLLSPLVLKASYEESLSAQVRYLFFRFRIAPPEEKEKKPKKKPKREKNGIGQKVGDLFREKGLGGFLKILGDAAGIAGKAAKGIFRHLTFSEFLLQITVGETDAAKTAETYGRVISAVSAAAAVFFEKARCRKCAVCINPDFCAEKSTVKFRMTAKIPVLFLIHTALRALFRSVSLVRSLKASQTGRSGRQAEKFKKAV